MTFTDSKWTPWLPKSVLSLRLFMCTMMAGVMLVILGVTGTGTAVRFIPRPVVIGFTNGIAVLIASTQIRDFLGQVTAKYLEEGLGSRSRVERPKTAKEVTSVKECPPAVNP